MWLLIFPWPHPYGEAKQCPRWRAGNFGNGEGSPDKHGHVDGVVAAARWNGQTERREPPAAAAAAGRRGREKPKRLFDLSRLTCLGLSRLIFSHKILFILPVLHYLCGQPNRLNMRTQNLYYFSWAKMYIHNKNVNSGENMALTDDRRVMWT